MVWGELTGSQLPSVHEHESGLVPVPYFVDRGNLYAPKGPAGCGYGSCT
jgi:hypothetical protein